MSKPKYNQNINLTIQTLGTHGEGIGYWHGYTVFVEDALPGEVIQGKITHTERRFGRAKVTSYESRSAKRTTPICELFGKCGGCQLMHFNYEAQLNFKRKRVVEALERQRLLHAHEIVQPCIASPQPLAYRNKIQLPIKGEPGAIKIGLFARDTHDLVEIEACAVHCEIGEKIYQKICPLLKSYPIIPYQPETSMGEFRYVLIKTAVNTSQALVIFVVNQVNYQLLHALAKDILALCPEVKGVILNHNTIQGNVVLGDRYETLAGDPNVTERLGDLYFKVSPASFFQVNTAQAEALYAQALSYAELQSDDTVVDAYCGVGTLSLWIARHAKQVIGIECIPEAIVDAKENSAVNQINNVEFICDTTEKALPSITKADVVFLNPPRKGCDRSVLVELTRLAPKKIVYISCDPSSLARDLGFLVSEGYQIDAVQPFDMFPQTAHVETVVKLTWKDCGTSSYKDEGP